MRSWHDDSREQLLRRGLDACAPELMWQGLRWPSVELGLQEWLIARRRPRVGQRLIVEPCGSSRAPTTEDTEVACP